MTGELAGKSAIVTGAGRSKGMGRAIALKLAEMGANVTIADLKASMAGYEWYPTGDWQGIQAVATEIREIGGRALTIGVDVTDPELVQTMVEATVQEFGRLDILVNNAGGGPGVGPVIELPLEDWQKTVEINLTGTFLCSQAALKPMIAQGDGGRIINISSISAKIPSPNIAPYNASKAGVISLTQTIALEVAEYKITVNAICPGNIDTQLLVSECEFIAEMEGITPQEARQIYIEEVPLKRLGQAEDVAAVVAFLATPAADYVTGQAINVDGGITFH
jgi:3-oxoacyl-[acyl-carrier protein] reductase/meso-butanediol dehydrogenase/(S,S)-butanediol dehydrogenase/diacetyl reductase